MQRNTEFELQIKNDRLHIAYSLNELIIRSNKIFRRTKYNLALSNFIFQIRLYIQKRDNTSLKNVKYEIKEHPGTSSKLQILRLHHL